MEERQTVRNVGTIQSRFDAIYTADLQLEREYEESLLGLFFLYYTTDDYESQQSLVPIIFMLAFALERKTQDIQEGRQRYYG